MTITAQEAWVGRDSSKKIDVPPYLRQVVEEIAFQAREDKRVDRRSGVSQRLPITTLESLVSSAEQRVARNGEKSVVARVADVYAALPRSPANWNSNTKANSRARTPSPAN